MPGKFTIVILLALALFVSALFNSCAKEYSYEGGLITDSTGGGTTGDIAATFTLDGSPACNDPAIRGTYESGNKMTSANYIELLVNVKSPGTYVIKTDTVDGICFSGSGKFTQAGMQRVNLPAAGTAPDPGNYLFHVDARQSSCTFPLTITFPGYPATYVLESNYDTSCTNHTIIGVYRKGVALDGTNKVNIRTFVTIPGVYALQTNTVNGVSFLNAGTFAAAGVNYIDLVGSGTPLQSGSFTYGLHIIGPAPIGGAGCLFKVDFQ